MLIFRINPLSICAVLRSFIFFSLISRPRYSILINRNSNISGTICQSKCVIKICISYLNIILPIVPQGLAIALAFKVTPFQLLVTFISAFVTYGKHILAYELSSWFPIIIKLFTCQLKIAFRLDISSMILIKVLEFIHKIHWCFHCFGNRNSLNTNGINLTRCSGNFIILMADLNYRADLNIKKNR